MPRNYNQGKYEVQNKSKYVGDPEKVRYLSSYELEFFKWADRSPAVIKWGSEVVVVKYRHPFKQTESGKPRISRYIVDIYIEYKDRSGKVYKELIEIKPESQCKKPRRGRKKESTFLEEQLTWDVNQAKWEAATHYAKERGWRFQVLTESAIFR